MTTSLAAIGVAAHLGGPYGPWQWPYVLIPIFWTLLTVFIIVMLVRGRRRAVEHGYGPWAQHGPWAAVRNAETTLAERFAQGDIDEKEYRARLEVLRANAGPNTKH